MKFPRVKSDLLRFSELYSTIFKKEHIQQKEGNYGFANRESQSLQTERNIV